MNWPAIILVLIASFLLYQNIMLRVGIRQLDIIWRDCVASQKTVLLAKELEVEALEAKLAGNIPLYVLRLKQVVEFCGKYKDKNYETT